MTIQDGLQTMKLQDLKSKSPTDLLAFAEELEIENASSMRKQDMLFAILKELRHKGITILLIEQNARQALQISDDGLVLEQGRTRIEDTAQRILADPRIAQLFLGGGLKEPERAS